MGGGVLAVGVVVLLAVMLSRGKKEAKLQAAGTPPAANPPAGPPYAQGTGTVPAGNPPVNPVVLPEKKADDAIKPAAPAPMPAAPADHPEAVTGPNEYDAVFDDGSRTAAKNLNTPDTFYFGPLRMDSKGRVVSRLGMAGRVTKDTTIAMGVFDEQKKKWLPGEAIEGGYRADIFKDMGKALRVRVTVGDGKIDKPGPGERAITQILVTNTDWKLVYASGDYDAIFKGLGRTNVGGRVAAAFVRVELDEQGRVIKYLGEFITSVTQDTKVVMGKYNEKEKSWDAGADIPGGLWSFKDPGLKPIFVRITPRADGGGIAQILVLQIGEPGKK